MTNQFWVHAVLVFTATATCVRCTEHIQLVYLEQDGNNKAALKIFFTHNSTETILVEQVRSGQNRSILTAHKSSGWICWVGKLESDSHPEIDCYNQRMLVSDTFTLPIRMPPSKLAPKNPNVYIYLELDVYGNSIYWIDPISANVWATSLLSKASKVIMFKFKRHWSFFNLDSCHGYFFGAYKHIYEEHASSEFASSANYESGGSYVIKVGETKLVQDREGSMLFHEDRATLAVDSCSLNVYWMQSSKIYFTSYKDSEAIKKNLLTRVPEMDQCEACLQFFNGYLFMRSNKGELFSLHVNSTRIDRLTNVSIPSDYTLYEDRSPGELNPCDVLACTHLCLPKFSKGYTCSCPSGMSLINGTSCKSSVIASLKKQKTSLYYPQTGNLSEVYQECRIRVRKAGGTTEATTSEKFLKCPAGLESPVENISSLPTLTNLDEFGIKFQLDPYGISMLLKRDDSRCIEIFSLKTRSTSTLLCATAVIDAFVVDYFNWIIFWVEKSPKSDTFFAIGKNFPIGTPAYKFPLRDYDYGLAVNPMEETVYWITGEIANFKHTIISADYEGGAQRTAFPAVEAYPHVFYQIMENRLFRYVSKYGNESGSRENAVRVYDFDTNVTTTIIKHDRIGIPLVFVPAVIGTHPCSTSKCSHTCVPRSASRFTCGCPGFLLPISDDCKSFNVAVNYFSPSSRNFSNLLLTRALVTERTLVIQNTSTSPLIMALETGPLVHRYNHSDVCWMAHTIATLQCTGDASVVFDLATVNWYTSMLVFNENGNEIFYNNGSSYGNITLRSLTTNTVYNFPTFEPTQVTCWTLDTQRKIFLWSGEPGSVHYQVLHETNRGGNVVYFPGTSNIASMTVDMYSRTLYFFQGREIKGIAYKELFAGNEQATAMHIYEFERFKDPITKKLLVPEMHEFQYFKKSLYWINGSYSSERHLSKIDIQSQGFETLPLKLRVASFRIVESTDERHQVDPCADSPCSHFCFPESPLQEFSFSHKCACPEGLTLVNGYSCEIVKDPVAPDNTSLITWMSLVSILGLLIIAGLAFALWKNHKKNAQLSNVIDEIRNGNPRGLKSARTEADRAQYLPLTCIVSPSELDVNESKVLGEGAFGMVLQGVFMKNTVVAVKTLKPSFNVNQLSDFAKEIKIMNYIGEHNHIVRFFGAEISNIKKGSLYAILEFSSHGSLLGYLRKNSPVMKSSKSCDYDNEAAVEENECVIELRPISETDDVNPGAVSTANTQDSEVTTRTLVSWAEQIASGMAYLMQKSVVHGDLAARNVLVFESNIVKISDFGLSKQLYDYANYVKKNKAPLPWRWMALESLKFMQFSSKSDVWAYGVTIWEVFTFGEVPYLEHVWNQNFKNLLQNGLMLPKPDACPEQLYEKIMKLCWNLDAELRPSFTDILAEFQSLHCSMRSDVLAPSVEYEIM